MVLPHLKGNGMKSQAHSDPKSWDKNMLAKIVPAWGTESHLPLSIWGFKQCSDGVYWTKCLWLWINGDHSPARSCCLNFYFWLSLMRFFFSSDDNNIHPEPKSSQLELLVLDNSPRPWKAVSRKNELLLGMWKLEVWTWEVRWSPRIHLNTTFEPIIRWNEAGGSRGKREGREI